MSLVRSDGHLVFDLRFAGRGDTVIVAHWRSRCKRRYLADVLGGARRSFLGRCADLVALVRGQDATIVGDEPEATGRWNEHVECPTRNRLERVPSRATSGKGQGRLSARHPRGAGGGVEQGWL